MSEPRSGWAGWADGAVLIQPVGSVLNWRNWVIGFGGDVGFGVAKRFKGEGWLGGGEFGIGPGAIETGAELDYPVFGFFGATDWGIGLSVACHAGDPGATPSGTFGLSKFGFVKLGWGEGIGMYGGGQYSFTKRLGTIGEILGKGEGYADRFINQLPIPTQLKRVLKQIVHQIVQHPWGLIRKSFQL